jgi:hypothetical protein
MEGEHDLLKRRCVLIAQEVIYESGIFSIALGPLAIGDPGGLHNPRVATKVINKADKPFVENRELLVQDLFCFRNYDSSHGILSQSL